MLIYNFQKEFIGIGQEDLEVFGFANLEELKAESTDFADMFVRTPGYIHNFKHVHWIDFVTCADPSETSKVIIEVNSKTYKATLKIKILYLSDNPSSKAYLIELDNLRGLTLKENGEFSEDIARKQPLTIEPDVGFAFNTPQEKTQTMDTLASKAFQTPTTTKETVEKEELKSLQEPFEETPQTEEASSHPSLDISFDDDIDNSIFETTEKKSQIIQESPTESLNTQESDLFSIDSLELESIKNEEQKKETPKEIHKEEDDYDYSYKYDPQVASDELGLPIDLIEEFIEDFIIQAKEFKGELYSSLQDGDLDNVKILSHKLKGVAANLRIEDAFNTLSIINTSSDISEVEKYLPVFYKIITKLSGEEIESSKPLKESQEEEETTSPVSTPDSREETQEDTQELDIYEDAFFNDNKEEKTQDTDIGQISSHGDRKKEEEEDLYLDFDIEIEDSEVPKKIDIPELADDDFLNSTQESSLDKEETFDELLIEPVVGIEEELEIEIEQEELNISYSKEIVADEIGLDAESFNEIFNDYITDSQKSISSITEAISQNDFIRSKKEAIKLKGMSDNMRINAFKDELNTLINSSNKKEISLAIKKIDAVIAQISK